MAMRLPSRTGLPLLVVVSVLVNSGASQANPTRSRDDFSGNVVGAATRRPPHPVRCVSDYVGIAYPGGDVPADTGVCTDEVIRIYRAVGVDLQKEVHEDMQRDFSVYPHKQQRHPDSHIDHRRVPKLMVFFARKGEVLPISFRRGVHYLVTLCRVLWGGELRSSESGCLKRGLGRIMQSHHNNG